MDAGSSARLHRSRRNNQPRTREVHSQGGEEGRDSREKAKPVGIQPQLLQGSQIGHGIGQLLEQVVREVKRLDVL